jgi:hypothetical protein
VVVNTDTIVNPSTMMIKALNAHIANVAMARPRSLDNLAIEAQFGCIKLLEEFQKVNLGVWFENTRVFSDRHDIWNKHLCTNHGARDCIIPGRVVYTQ